MVRITASSAANWVRFPDGEPRPFAQSPFGWGCTIVIHSMFHQGLCVETVVRPFLGNYRTCVSVVWMGIGCRSTYRQFCMSPSTSPEWWCSSTSPEWWCHLAFSGSWQQGQGVEHSLRYRLRHFCICLSQHSVFFNTTMMWIRTFTEGGCSLGTKFKTNVECPNTATKVARQTASVHLASRKWMLS